MSDVTFDEPEYAVRSAASQPKRQSLLTRLTISTGLATDEASAQRVLLIGAVIIAALAIAVYLYGQFAVADGKFIPSNPPAV